MEKMTYEERVRQIAEEMQNRIETAKNGHNMRFVFMPAARIAVAKMAEAAELLYWDMHNTCDGTEAYIPEYMKVRLNEILIEYGLIPDQPAEPNTENNNWKL